MYDSTKDTLDHQENVHHLLFKFIGHLIHRSLNHDSSKLKSPEKEMFDKYTPLLSSTTYGSDEYKGYLAEMGKALDHHYENNQHHPEHFEWGVSEMTLIDIIEMFCDWKAASQRHSDGDLIGSIEQNRDRFDLTDQLYLIFMNTAKDYGW